LAPEIIAVLIVMLVAVALFISEKIRVDIIALMVMVSLAILGLISPEEALSGFSSPAVVTVWAVLILSTGLSRTGVASMLGSRLIALANDSQSRLVLILMFTVGLLSGLMNNIGAVSLLLPVALDAARRIRMAPSKILMPLAFASLLGGMMTLIGTPSNILISEALRSYGLQPFGMFDYTPIGVVLLVIGVLFIFLIGRRLLPTRDISREISQKRMGDKDTLFSLQERLFMVDLPVGSALPGKTLEQSRLGSLLAINVVGVVREGHTILSPGAHFTLRPDDRLLVSGQLDNLTQIMGDHLLEIEDESLPVEFLLSENIHFAEVSLTPQSEYIGKSLAEIHFRQLFGVNVLAIWRDDEPIRANLQCLELEIGDVLLLQGPASAFEGLEENHNFLVSSSDHAQVYRLHESLIAMHVSSESDLVGKQLSDSRLGEVYGLQILGIVREGITRLMPAPDERLAAGDTLLAQGQPHDLDALRSLRDIEFTREGEISLSQLESESIGHAEVALTPHSSLVGKSLRQIHFRDKFGLNVLAIWRQGHPYRSNLSDMEIKFGDALLVYGLREKLKILGEEPGFLVLTQDAAAAPRKNKALIATLIMAGVLLPVVLGWLPIAIAAVMGAVLMVLTGCLKPEETYQGIEWKAIFLIAGMLPLGIALEKTGAAQMIAESMVNFIGPYGPYAIIAGIFTLAAVASQVMPNPAVVVLLAPIAMNTAADMGISPYPLMMTVAIAASAAFMSPVGHPVNVLIMGPGGYRFSDYTKMGIPLMLVILAVVLFLLPVFFPF